MNISLDQADSPSRPSQAREAQLIREGEFWIRADNAEQDLVVVRDIFEQDAYRTYLLADNAGPDEVVVDIGAHIGTFARLWHRKNPQARIVCVEACPENLAALRANVGDFAHVVHAACTYETAELMLLNAVRPDCESTGGSVVVPRSEHDSSPLRQEGYHYWNDYRELPKVTLEELMSRFGFNHINILKLDCEGSEYSILGKTTVLSRIRIIVGEYHFRARWDEFRRRRLAGWDYGHMQDAGDRGGLFHYANPIWPPPMTAPVPVCEPLPSLRPQPPGAAANSNAGALLDSPVPRKLLRPPLLRVAVPAGIGDSVWALMKIPHLLRVYGAEQAHVALCGPPPHRALSFVERFDFVASAEYSHWECVEANYTTPEGTYNWAPSGIGWHHEFDWMLQANRHLESGLRLESWLPEMETDWHIADRFRFTACEVREAIEFERQIGPYCIFYLGPESGNTTCGHNRGPLWTPQDWGALARLFRERGLKIVVVGASYDQSYFEKYAGAHIGECVNKIGASSIGQTFSAVQRARCVIAYQSGIGIFAVYLGVPTACFWRPYGNSIDGRAFVSFKDEMASAWAPLDALRSGRYLPSIYTRCTPESIVQHAQTHDWLRETNCRTTLANSPGG